METDFIDDEWTKRANNRMELGAYKGTKEEWRKWYLAMPDSRKGDLYDLIRHFKKRPNDILHIRFALFSR
jgi:hypothetical protein